jgi:hypothetical protein
VFVFGHFGVLSKCEEVQYSLLSTVVPVTAVSRVVLLVQTYGTSTVAVPEGPELFHGLLLSASTSTTVVPVPVLVVLSDCQSANLP